MKTVSEIKEILDKIAVPQDGFNFFDDEGILWGKDAKGYITFAVYTSNQHVLPMTQKTKYLKLNINCPFSINTQNGSAKKRLSLLVLTSLDSSHIDLFIKLSLSFCESLDETKLLSYFMDLKELFSRTDRLSQLEVQGIFGELLSIVFLYDKYGIDISHYYQKEQKEKFDFSISDFKKIEVKSTLKPLRIHHFLQHQLDTSRFDIVVISVMLQKDDKGISLYDLIKMCEDRFSNNLSFLIQLETIIKKAHKEDLSDLTINYDYCTSNLKVFYAKDIPRIHEKNEDGVFNVQYDCDLTNSNSMGINVFKDWLDE